METNPAFNSDKSRRFGHNFIITKDEIEQFNTLGYVVINNVLSEDEMKSLDPWFERFISGKERERMGKDYCDMSQPYDTPVEHYQLINAMLPSHYCPAFSGNIFHKITQNIANQLYPNNKAAIDYEQFLAKKPSKQRAAFALHQDLGYWPKTKNTWTATFSLAMNDATTENGCLYVIPGSNKEAKLRKHVPMNFTGMSLEGMDRENSHTLVIKKEPGDTIVQLPIKRGGITIHDERIVHGSGGNNSDIWRKTYIVAYRDVETIKEERAMGFTHSHNDDIDWNTVI